MFISELHQFSLSIPDPADEPKEDDDDTGSVT
jgi:hypothetical protein